MNGCSCFWYVAFGLGIRLLRQMSRTVKMYGADPATSASTHKTLCVNGMSMLQPNLKEMPNMFLRTRCLSYSDGKDIGSK